MRRSRCVKTSLEVPRLGSLNTRSGRPVAPAAGTRSRGCMKGAQLGPASRLHSNFPSSAVRPTEGRTYLRAWLSRFCAEAGQHLFPCGHINL